MRSRSSATSAPKSAPAKPLLVASDPRDSAAIRRILSRLPALKGAEIRVERFKGLRDRRGPVHAGAFLRERRIALDCTRAELPRIVVHELFHFVWLRLGNPLRHSYEDVLHSESGAGELGWSAEWRRAALTRGDIAARTCRWREYCCESFCDTAAWLYAGLASHPEFTLDRASRTARRRWFRENLETRVVSI